MANRAMQQKALKLQAQRAARPYELNLTRPICTPDPVQRLERAPTLRLEWAGDRIVRADDGAKQRQLVLSYAEAGVWTLHKGGKPKVW